MRGGANRVPFRLALTIFFTVLLVPGIASARQVTFQGAQFSSLEQASRLTALTTSLAGQKIWPLPIKSIGTKPYIQKDLTVAYGEGDRVARTRISETVGDQAAARYAEERGLKKLLGSKDRGIRQGIDSLYLDPYSGRTLAIERKGGRSKLEVNYGALQGTNRYSVQAARRALLSAKVPHAEKVKAARVLIAAQDRTLDSGVVRGGVKGRNTRPVFTPGEALANAPTGFKYSVPDEARRFQKDLKHRPGLDAVFREAHKEHRFARTKFRTGQGLAGLGLLASAGLAVDALEQSSKALDMFAESGYGTSAQPYFQASFAAGRATEAGVLALSSSARLNLLGSSSSAQSIGKAAGKMFLPVAMVTEALGAGTVYLDYAGNRISSREFYRSISGPTVFAGFTAAGYAIGFVVGAVTTDGLGATAAAWLGAEIGAVVAIPFQMLVDGIWDYRYGEFNEGQRRAIEVATYKHYGVEFSVQ
jgi:hypothetical protein